MPQLRNSGDGAIQPAPGTPTNIHTFALLVQPPAWYEHALCSQTSPEAFFPVKGENAKPAKRVCQGCPVRAECLNYALDNDERWGVWGGLSELDRRRLKRPVACTVCGTEVLRAYGKLCDDHRRKRNPPATGHQPQAEIRAWANANSIPVNSRGTLPRSLVEQYEAAHRPDQDGAA